SVASNSGRGPILAVLRHSPRSELIHRQRWQRGFERPLEAGSRTTDVAEWSVRRMTARSVGVRGRCRDATAGARGIEGCCGLTFPSYRERAWRLFTDLTDRGAIRCKISARCSLV